MASGEDFAEEWPTDAESVCDKFTCYEESEGGKGQFESCCYGE